jgi:hypothetical protein
MTWTIFLRFIKWQEIILLYDLDSYFLRPDFDLVYILENKAN